MNKKISALALAGLSLALTACGAMHDKLADLSMQHKSLANGQAISAGTNVIPTAAWNCQEVGQRQGYNWDSIQTTAQFHANSPTGYLFDEAVAYANQQSLNANYVNLQIPKQTSIEGFNIHPHEKAYAVFYRCEKINPDHQLGGMKKTSYNFS